MKKILFSCAAFFIVASANLYSASTGAVVINEVAWMGTEFKSSHEWMELYNTTQGTIDMDGWSIETEDGQIVDLSSSDSELNFSTIGAGGYYLIEYRSGSGENAIKDLIGGSEGLAYQALSDSGENLYLKDSSGNIIDTVDCADGWYAGDGSNKYSMERIAPDSPGTDTSNWGTNDLSNYNGTDYGDNMIYGTPAQQNSLYGKTIYRTTDMLEIKNSPFFPFGNTSGTQKTESKIYYKVKSGSRITIKIFNTNGNLIKTLANSKTTSSSTGNYSWTGIDSNNEKVPMGLYIVHIKAVDSNGEIKTDQAAVAVGRNFK